LRVAFEGIAQEAGLACAMEEILYFAPIAFDEDCVAAVRQGAVAQGYGHRDIVSGAGHDACYLSKAAPTGMIFVPCKDGLSHNEAESATPEDLAAGCNVLLHAVLSAAGG
jgi:N-carbamoyl-L-amino-acid hydrolase